MRAKSIVFIGIAVTVVGAILYYNFADSSRGIENTLLTVFGVLALIGVALFLFHGGAKGVAKYGIPQL